MMAKIQSAWVSFQAARHTARVTRRHVKAAREAKREFDRHRRWARWAARWLPVLLLTFAGCETLRRGRDWIDGKISKPEAEFPAGLTWLHTDVSGWPVTSRLGNVSVGGMVDMPYDKARVWPRRNTAGAFVNANPWVVFEYQGAWYAATWEWMRFGQTAKARSALAGDHIKRNPIPNNWRPAPGQRIGIFVSGLARSDVRNVQERTNLVWITWP